MILWFSFICGALAKDYIITFKEGVVSPHINGNFEPFNIGDLNGFIIKDSPMTLKEVKKIPLVDTVDEDSTVMINEETSWALLRIAYTNPDYKNDKYTPKYKGEGIDIYILDTGVFAENVEFEENQVIKGWNSIERTDVTKDRNGHGTHVASLAAGTNFGVAPKATIIPVKVLNDQGSGSWSGVIRGIEWVVKNVRKRKRCSIISMSLGGIINKAANKAVEKAIKIGIRVVVAAGNSGNNACGYSPASAKGAITVGATTQSDVKSYFSNIGNCVDILAPGSNVKGAWIGGKSSTRVISGTSMSAPLVSGALAQILQEKECQRGAEDLIKEKALKNVIKDVPSNTPNLLLHVSDVFNTTCSDECSSIKEKCRCRLNNEINVCSCKWNRGKYKNRCVIAI